MSDPMRTNDARGMAVAPSMFPETIYAPPWARDAAVRATDAALAASEKLRRVLPRAAQLGVREPRPFEGDIAIQRLRSRPSLEPCAVPAPPMRTPGSAAGVLARVCGAIGIAALAAFFMVGTAPLSLAVKAEDEGAAASFWSRFVFPTAHRQQTVASSAFKLAAAESSAPAQIAERLAAASPKLETRPFPRDQDVAVVPAMPSAVAPAVLQAAASQAPMVRALEPGEIARLYQRGEDFIAQGDIASARLMFTRAAEAGDARAALALGAAYDPAVLKRLGVLGVAADAGQAREWYEKAARFGSGEATRRLEVIAQAR